MTNPLNKNEVKQTANSGRNITQVGRDYTHSNTVQIWASVFLFGVLAMGGLAWAFNVGNIKGGNPQIPQPSTPSTAKPSK